MKKLLPIFLIIIGLNACQRFGPKENNYTEIRSGIVRKIREYPNANCDIQLENEFWTNGVSLNDCKNLNIGDKILIIEKVEDGLVEIKIRKLNPNLP